MTTDGDGRRIALALIATVFLAWISSLIGGPCQ